MACNAYNLGFDIDQDYLACIDFRVSAKTYYFSCDFNSFPNISLTCTAFTDSGCTQVFPTDGYFANENGTRFYSKAVETLEKFDFCELSNYLKSCCNDSEFYFAPNLESIIGYLPPVGSIVQLEVTDSNLKTFKSCFEVVSPVSISVPTINVNNFYQIFGFGKCSECQDDLLNDYGVNCYLTPGKYFSTNCTGTTVITLEVVTPNTLQIGDTVLYNGSCYTLSDSASTETSLGQVTMSVSNGCLNPICNPIPPVTINSRYVSGCCDNKLYRLLSNNAYPLGSTINLNRNNFCYRVVQEPSNITPFSILNDNGGAFQVTNCNDKKCQPCFTPPPIPPPGSTANECNIITILPLGIKCVSVNPTVQNPNGGILSVEVTGGTSPYNYFWTSDLGRTYTGQTIFNLPAGNYNIKVFDRWSDFNAETTCSLVAPQICSFSGSVVPVVALSFNQSSNIKGYAYTSAISP